VSGHQGVSIASIAVSAPLSRGLLCVMETTTDQSSKCTYLYIPALLKSLEDDSQRALVRLFKLLHRQIFAIIDLRVATYICQVSSE